MINNCISRCLAKMTRQPPSYFDSLYDKSLKPHWWKIRLVALGRRIWKRFYFSKKPPITWVDYISIRRTKSGTTHAVIERGYFNPHIVYDPLGSKKWRNYLVERTWTYIGMWIV